MRPKRATLQETEAETVERRREGVLETVRSSRRRGLGQSGWSLGERATVASERESVRVIAEMMVGVGGLWCAARGAPWE